MADEQQNTGKFKKVIEVHGKNGTYNRVQTVGSDVKPLASKHHGLDTIMGDPAKQAAYHQHLQSLIPHKGEYYHLHEKIKVSQGRTSFGSGKYQGATKYKLHHIEKEYKKHLDKEAGIDHSGKEQAVENALYENNWYGSTDTRFTAAHEHIKAREEKPVEELHKEGQTSTGKKLISKEEAEQKETAEIQNEKARQHNEAMYDVISKNIESKLKGYNYKTSTVKDFNRFLNMDIRRYGQIKPDMKVTLTLRNGGTRERTWKQMRDWVTQQVENPAGAGQPLPFTDMKVEMPPNPHKLDSK